MKVTKAIEILDIRPGQTSFFLLPDRLAALQLGIEALKAYKKSQEARWYPPGYKLPGETPENDDKRRVR